MLKELHISNFAVVEDVVLTFSDGLNVLTGSTGAGKSLILSAVNLLRGERANPDLIRSGESKALVEATFLVERSMGVESLNAHGGNTVTLRREITSSGRSYAFVDGSQIPLKSLASVAGRFIEPHGQNEQMKLRFQENHVRYLDEFAGIKDLVDSYGKLLNGFNESLRALGVFDEKMRLAKEKRELLEQRIEEIERAGLKKGEKEDLERAISMQQNSQRIVDAVNGASIILNEEDDSAVTKVCKAEKMMERIEDFGDNFALMAARLREARIIIKECASEMLGFLNSFEFDPGKFEMMQERLAFIQSLERRYRKNADEIVEESSLWREQIESLEREDEEREELEGKLEDLREQLKKKALALSSRRRKAARLFDEQVTKCLRSMMIKGAIFRTEVSRVIDENSGMTINGGAVHLFRDGIDRVEFYIRTNEGEREGPAARIASTGEASRIALALKDVLKAREAGGVMIFDELDAGVGADMGRAIAEKLKSLSKKYQIICITHLPQIAAAAGKHLTVRKGVHQGRTTVSVDTVTGDNRKREIARMLGGERGSQRRLQLAEEMLEG